MAHTTRTKYSIGDAESAIKIRKNATIVVGEA